MKYKFTYFVILVVFLVHASDSFSAMKADMNSTNIKVEEEPVRAEPVDNLERKGYERLQPADPEKDAEKVILGSDITFFALSLRGKPYVWAGDNPSEGFDCSGFIYFVYKEFGIDLPHSSRALYTHGSEVEEAEAMPGDLIFFHGTNPASKQVGHVGIVISQPDEETVRFVHSSTGRGVIEDSLLKKNYRRRYIGIKRIL